MVTLGPSTEDLDSLKKLKTQSVDFVRANLSHTSLDELEHFISLAKTSNIPFVLDTEGSQVRTGLNRHQSVEYLEGDEILIHDDETLCDEKNITLSPTGILDKLDPGDMIYVDFNSVAISIIGKSEENDRALLGVVKSSGSTGSNKGVFIDSLMNRPLELDVITKKDKEAIKLGIKNSVPMIALSFVRKADDIKKVRKITEGKMEIISKIECIDAIENLKEIIDETDYLLIDRGDLSKEVAMEKIPMLQKTIISEALKKDKITFVATNLLESMLDSKMPTRAEVHDVSQTIISGAGGLILAAETAIGNNPFLCVNMIKKIINETRNFDLTNKNGMPADILSDEIVEQVMGRFKVALDQIEPHGGKLVNSVIQESEADLSKKIPRIEITESVQMDLEQICLGSYSPIDGFMDSENLDSVLNNYTLANGLLWPLPILLDISHEKAKEINGHSSSYLVDHNGAINGVIEISEIYPLDKEKLCHHLYNSNDKKHPGVRNIERMSSHLVAGKVSLFQRALNKNSGYMISPSQSRKFFQSKNWEKIVGFHTRNVIHRAHEHIQMKAIERLSADGLFLHPVIGEKKKGDYLPEAIIKSYRLMSEKIYPKDKTLFGTFSTFSRYAGYRELLFTAICRQNFGCTHFIVGRDHTQSDSDQSNLTRELMLNLKKQMKIRLEFFENVKYSQSIDSYVEVNNEKSDDFEEISGTETREMIKSGVKPPIWFMRDEISNLLIASINNDEKIFVE